MFVSLLGFRIEFSGCTSTFSAAAKGNLFKSEQLSLNVAVTGLAFRVKTKPITQINAELRQGFKGSPKLRMSGASYTINAGQGRGETLIRSSCFLQLLHVIERTIGCLKQCVDGCSILRINRNSKTHGKQGLLVIAGQTFAHPASNCVSFLMPGFR